MKVIRLTTTQTKMLEDEGVALDADVYIPAGRGPGNYSVCEHCEYILHTIKEGGVLKGCRVVTPHELACPEIFLTY